MNKLKFIFDPMIMVIWITVIATATIAYTAEGAGKSNSKFINSNKFLKRVCIDNVVYIVSSGDAITVKFNQHGSVELCVGNSNSNSNSKFVNTNKFWFTW